MSLIKLYVRTNNQKYPIIIGNNILKDTQKFFKSTNINFNRCLIVVDKNVPKTILKKIFESFAQKKNKYLLF